MGCDRVVVVLTRERSYRREPEKLQPFIDVRYRRYPHFCETMRRRAETYNASRERLFQLEREGKVLLFAPRNTQGFSRIERDVDKIRALWQDGYEQTKARAGEVRLFWGQKTEKTKKRHGLSKAVPFLCTENRPFHREKARFRRGSSRGRRPPRMGSDPP